LWPSHPKNSKNHPGLAKANLIFISDNGVILIGRWKTAVDVPYYRSYVYPIYACASVFNRMSFFQSIVRNVKVGFYKNALNIFF
jgi:hypothetical protein